MFALQDEKNTASGHEKQEKSHDDKETPVFLDCFIRTVSIFIFILHKKKFNVQQNSFY